MTHDDLARAMQGWGLLEDPPPAAALVWIQTFLQAYGAAIAVPDDARPLVTALREESCSIPALELERLRSRDALFFLDAVGQYVDQQAELAHLPLDHDLRVIAQEFGLDGDEALRAVRMALTGRDEGPALDLLFPLLGHDRILVRIGAVNARLLHGRGLQPIAYGPGGEPFAPIRGKRPGNGEKPESEE